MSRESEILQQALLNARQAYKAGDLPKARRWAQSAAAMAPEQEEPWLWMAAVSSPRASIGYLKRALQISPDSQRARQGMQWAVKRLRASPPRPTPAPLRVYTRGPAATALPPVSTELPGAGLHFTNFQWVLILIIVSLLLFAVSFRPLQMAFNIPQDLRSLPKLVGIPQKATNTLLPTHTPTVTPSPTPLPTDTPTATPTDTATPVPTATPLPPPTDTPVPYEPAPVDIPDVGGNERWIDVDLSLQQVQAYQGSDLLQTFIVSTGTWEHPTVTGQYYIYAKYESAPMWGPDYYLPGVPYTMYFYKGYALHGTYWHENFGIPMSHGCINLRTPDAEWLFYWASIGTLVNIHY